MDTAQNVLNTLHDQFGLTDIELGEALAVSREHISRLRHGKKNASEGLYNEICDLLTEMSSGIGASDQGLQSDDGSEVSSGGIPWGVIIVVGILIVGIIVVAIVAHVASSKDQESDQEIPEQEQGSQLPPIPPYRTPE
jgi:hypothetical protein